MQIHFTLNHKKTAAEIAPDTLLIDLVRSLGCKSVKRGCETANCGLCTVFLDEKPVLSCSVLAARVDGRSVTTLEGLPLAGGFGLNVTNPLSAKEYAALGARMLTLSPELTLEDMARISAPVPVLALAYGHMPLMLTRACPLQNVRDCGGCDRKGELLDRKGMRFPVRCSGPAGARTVYNPIPIYMGDRLKELPVELPLLYFTIETAARVREVLALVREGLPFDGPFTRGLYYKGTN